MQPLADSSSHATVEDQSLVDLLSRRSREFGGKQAFSFLAPDGSTEAALSYRALHERAMAVAAELQTLAPPVERALLLFPPGLDFITAFFGCLYAGVVAVPAAVPGRNRMTTQIESIYRAARPSVVLSTAAHREQALRTYAAEGEIAARSWIAVDGIATERVSDWLDGEDTRTAGRLAFLQFTSGSTSAPKGVMLNHEHLLYNASLIDKAFHTTSESHAVSWLPLNHDMGLIGGVIQPIYCGGSATLMAPAAFLQRPALWLETISRTRATIAGGPDFGFDLCARKVTSEARQQLDLSCWQLAFVGAERIREQTIERFSRAFDPCGFRREAFFPCYGLAEATLMVSGGPRQTPPTILHLAADALEQNRAEIVAGVNGHAGRAPSHRAVVGCGENLCGQQITIVDPGSRLPLADGAIGEIWLRGRSVAAGYFEDAEATAATFAAHLADSGESGDDPFLRTGDLGFLLRGQLFVTGRLKNLIIIRGRNHYPEDIEQTIDSVHPGLRAGHAAAFPIEVEEQDQLVVVQEVEPRHRLLDADAAIHAIRAAIANRHELEVHAVNLVRAGTLPQTSSGKARRGECRQRYLRGEFAVVASWQAVNGNGHHQSAETPLFASAPASQPCERSAHALPPAEIETWLVERIAARLRLRAADVKVSTPFLELGLSSLDAVEIAAGLERWLGRHLSPTAIYNYPTITALAKWLSLPPSGDESACAAPSRFSFPPTVDSEQLQAEVRRMSDGQIESFLAAELAKHKSDSERTP